MYLYLQRLDFLATRLGLAGVRDYYEFCTVLRLTSVMAEDIRDSKYDHLQSFEYDRSVITIRLDLTS